MLQSFTAHSVPAIARTEILVPRIGETEILVPPSGETKKRGRPVSGCAVSHAERNRKYRAKRQLVAAVLKARRAGLDVEACLREWLGVPD